MAALIGFLLAPLVTLASLALLPPGRPALVGLVAAALAVLVLGTRIAPEDGSGFGTLLLWTFGGAVALAAAVQAVRLTRREADAPPPVLAGLVAVAALLPLSIFLGLI